MEGAPKLDTTWPHANEATHKARLLNIMVTGSLRNAHNSCEQRQAREQAGRKDSVKILAYSQHHSCSAADRV